MLLLYPLHITNYVHTVSTANTESCSYSIHCTYRIMFSLYPLHIQNHVLTVPTAHTELCSYCTHCTYTIMFSLYPLHIQCSVLTVSTVHTEVYFILSNALTLSTEHTGLFFAEFSVRTDSGCSFNQSVYEGNNLLKSLHTPSQMATLLPLKFSKGLNLSTAYTDPRCSCIHRT